MPLELLFLMCHCLLGGTVLDLSINGLTGHIPASLGNLTSLQELQLSVNKVSGPIPAELARCTNLTDLELDNSQISLMCRLLPEPDAAQFVLCCTKT